MSRGGYSDPSGGWGVLRLPGDAISRRSSTRIVSRLFSRRQLPSERTCARFTYFCQLDQKSGAAHEAILVNTGKVDTALETDNGRDIWLSASPVSRQLKADTYQGTCHRSRCSERRYGSRRQSGEDQESCRSTGTLRGHRRPVCQLRETTISRMPRELGRLSQAAS